MTNKQNPLNKKAHPGGTPAYAPTAKEREIVEEAAGFGLPHDKICQLIVSERTGKPIEAKTLRAVFHDAAMADWQARRKERATR